jgi:hypothetical protein
MRLNIKRTITESVCADFLLRKGIASNCPHYPVKAGPRHFFSLRT